MPFGSGEEKKGMERYNKTAYGGGVGSSAMASVKCPVCQAPHVPLEKKLSQGTYACTCVNCGHFFKFRAVQGNLKNTISFTVNGQQYTVGNEYNQATSILEYLREAGVSTGTKGCCYEGGCGMCLVTVDLLDPVTQTKKHYAVNGCCLQLFQCDGAEITTIEGLGNVRDGLHPIQERLAQHNGAQCGFCTPGQIMNMYGLLKTKGTVTAQEVEDAMDSSICRCTGYRSILDAMKSFAVDAPKAIQGGPVDIEELDRARCSKTGKNCVGRCSDKGKGSPCEHRMEAAPRPVHIVRNLSQWLKPVSLAELYPLLAQYAGTNYRLIFGNTAYGVFGEFGPWNYDVLIDIRGVQDLYAIDLNPANYITIGANVSVTSLKDIFTTTHDPRLPYAQYLAAYLNRVASNSIRNLCSWAGNLVMKKTHQDFPSDIFTAFETLGVRVTVAGSDGQASTYSLPDFLNIDLKGKVIISAQFPKYTTGNRFVRYYKTSHRLQFSHSLVCSGYNFELDSNQVVKAVPSIVIQGINSQLIHAVATEGFLYNKSLADSAVLSQALQTLSTEVLPTSDTNSSSPAYRKSLALGQFYRFVLDMCGTKCNVRYKSGGTPLYRPLMTGTQVYNDPDPDMFPVSKPTMKVIERYLATGEAKFLDDLPLLPGQLWAYPVLSTEGNADIKSIDPSAALNIPGVYGFLKASDIPGTNNWRPTGWPWYPPPHNVQEVLAETKVQFEGQPLGVIIANDRNVAWGATNAVKVEYENVKPPVVDMQEAIRLKQFFPNREYKKGDAAAAIQSAPHVIRGAISCGHQYHFHLENQVSICTPNDVGGMNVQATSQWLDAVCEAVSQVLGIPAATVNVETPRLGGAFGGKIFYNLPVSAMTALAAHKTRRPVKMFLDIHSNMRMQGKRTPYYTEFEVGVDSNGKLLGIKMDMYSDAGYLFLPVDSWEFVDNWVDNAYFCENWYINLQPVKTNKQTSTAMRAPGSTPVMFIMEELMDKVAATLKKDQLQVRQLNFFKNGQTSLCGNIMYNCIISEVVNQLVQECQFQQRKLDVAKFNSENRWKKRGIHIYPNCFSLSWQSAQYRTLVDINHADGSVFVAHGGIDMGQGINTKVIQTAAYKLGVPMDKIVVKRSSTIVNGNSFVSGGSTTSEINVLSVIRCCDQILERMAPVRARLQNPTWQELVNACFLQQIDLTAHYVSKLENPSPGRYQVYGACCAEVELDVLTGQYQINQLDYLYDCGQSLNPELDMGQVEGGFIMGMGYFLQEELKFDPLHGGITNDGTWEYKPPMGKDLPIKFNIKFLKKNPEARTVLRSKSPGEPPVALGATPLFALKRAIEAARAEIGNTEYVALNAPATVERVQQLCLNDINAFTLGN